MIEALFAVMVPPPPPERVRQERAGRLRRQQEGDLGHPPLEGDDLEDVKGERHHHRPAQPLGVDEEAEAVIRPEHLDPAPEVAGETTAGILGHRCLGFAGGDEGDAGDEEQARAQKHDGGVTSRERQLIQEAVGRRRHAEPQQAAAEEPDRQHAAAP